MPGGCQIVHVNVLLFPFLKGFSLYRAHKCGGGCAFIESLYGAGHPIDNFKLKDNNGCGASNQEV